MQRPGAVVLGAGAAGLRAAIALRDAGLPVQVLVKGAAGPSGATPSALFSYCCGQPGDPANPPELFYDDVMRSGHGINDPALVSLLARDAYGRLLELTEMGMPWTLTPDGSYERVGLPGHRAPRAFHAARRTGKALSDVLMRAAIARGVSFHQYALALDLLCDGPRIRGLAVLDLRTGQATAWPCSALVVATGGAPAVYRLNTNPPGQTGDGMALVLRAGGELVDMEFMQMYPTVLVHPPGAYGVEIATGRILSAGARLVNRDGEEFFERWEAGPVGKATRDVLARAIAREIAAGRGTGAGGVYLDARSAREAFERDRYALYLRDIGVDLEHDVHQVAPGAHYSLGGVRVAAPAACVGLQGVFAAGEVTGGVHGANRLAGNALPETQVFGALAGQAAAGLLQAGETSGRDEWWPPEGRALMPGESPAWDALLGARARAAGPSPSVLAQTLQEALQQGAGVVRTRAGLEAARDRVEEIARLWRGQMAVEATGGAWHPELIRAAELGNMIEVARALVACALLRTESRGAHYRDDYPEPAPEWETRNLVVKGSGDRMAVRAVERGGEKVAP